MSVWYTSYNVRGERVKTQVQARDAADLERIIKLRRMGEELSEPGFFARSPDMPSALIKRNQPAAAHHALHWVAMIAVRCLPDCAWDLLHDRGLLHEFAHISHNVEHYATSGYGIARQNSRSEGGRFYKDVQALELLIPGVHPWWGDAEAYADHGGFWEEVFAEAKAGLSLDNAIAEMRHHIALAEEEEQRWREKAAPASIDRVILPKRTMYESIFASPASIGKTAAQMAQLAQAMQPLMVSLDEFSKLRDVTVYTEKPNPKPGSKEAEAQARSQSAKAKAQNIERYKAAMAKRRGGVKNAQVVAVRPNVKPQLDNVYVPPFINQMQSENRFLRKPLKPTFVEEFVELIDVNTQGATLRALKDMTIDPDKLRDSVGEFIVTSQPRTAMQQRGLSERMQDVVHRARMVREMDRDVLTSPSQKMMMNLDYGPIEASALEQMQRYIGVDPGGGASKTVTFYRDPKTENLIFDIETQP